MAHSDPSSTNPFGSEEPPRLVERLPEDATIERVEERAVFGRRAVDLGGVRVATRTEARQETVRDILEDVSVEVERRPVDRVVEAAEAPRVEGDVTILPVYEERLVVEKRLVLVEEVHVRRRTRSREVEMPVELRRQVAEVERLPPRDGQLETPDTHEGVYRMMDDNFRGTQTVTAMFDNAAEAERAVSRLRSAGISDTQIRHTPGASQPTGTVDYNDSTYRDQHKGFWDSLSDFFFPDSDRYSYAEGLNRGSHMVTVTGFDPGMHDTIVDILDDEGSIDIDERENEWRQSGWQGHQESPYYADPDDISGTGGMAGGTSGLSGTTAGLGHTIDSPTHRDTDLNTRGTIYDDGMQDRTAQMAADTGRRSQADLGSQQAGYADTGSMRQSGGMGATGGMGQARGFGTSGVRDDDLNEDGTVKVVEERMNVGKRDVDQGRVRVRSYVREEPVSKDVDLRATRVHVDRRPVDRPLGAGDAQFRDQTIEAREHREEPVVNKEARVVEEIGLRKDTEVEHRNVQDTVRRTEVDIEDERTGQRTGLTGDRKDRDRF